VDRTKEQIKSAPEFDEDRYRDDSYREELGGHYNRPDTTRSDAAL
jgi:hypothetical protein